jgi:hypothetical protein
MLTVPETTTGLKPEFLVVVDKIYRQLCNLQAGTQVLIITDSRTPRHVITVFMGMAMAMGAIVSISENHLAPPPADQPRFKWNPMLVAAARQADLIIDFAVGYADFMAEAIERGARILSPGDGTGGHHIEDSLIRTMLDVDLDKMRREAIHIGDRFTQARVLRMTSAPGIVLPKFSGDGVVAVDGFFLYSDIHQFPSSPVILIFEKGKIVKISGEDRLLVSRLTRWLDTIDGDTGRLGPVHFNVGLNPRARLTEHPEFEKIRGTVVMGLGDSSLLTRMWSPGRKIESVTSDVHWDFIVMRPTIALDNHVICTDGVMTEFVA